MRLLWIKFKKSDTKKPSHGIIMIMRTKIILETADILVCEKPAGLAVQSMSGYQADLVSELKNYLSEKCGRKNPYLGLIHRLDQPVEGLLAVARTKAAAADLSRRLADGTLKKKYLAILDGIPRQKEDTLIHYLKKDARTNRACICDDPQDGAKRAQLSYRILEEKNGHALAEIEITTGRFHQIRAQMAQAGYPLAGDARYGKTSGSGGLALCAYYLEFYDLFAKTPRKFVMRPGNERFAEMTVLWQEDFF